MGSGCQRGWWVVAVVLHVWWADPWMRVMCLLRCQKNGCLSDVENWSSYLLEPNGQSGVG